MGSKQSVIVRSAPALAFCCSSSTIAAGSFTVTLETLLANLFSRFTVGSSRDAIDWVIFNEHNAVARATMKAAKAMTKKASDDFITSCSDWDRLLLLLLVTEGWWPRPQQGGKWHHPPHPPGAPAVDIADAATAKHVIWTRLSSKKYSWMQTRLSSNLERTTESWVGNGLASEDLSEVIADAWWHSS